MKELLHNQRIRQFFFFPCSQVKDKLMKRAKGTPKQNAGVLKTLLEEITVWSDKATSQFKNQYIIECLKV